MYCNVISSNIGRNMGVINYSYMNALHCQTKSIANMNKNLSNKYYHKINRVYKKCSFVLQYELCARLAGIVCSLYDTHFICLLYDISDFSLPPRASRPRSPRPASAGRRCRWGCSGSCPTSGKARPSAPPCLNLINSLKKKIMEILFIISPPNLCLNLKYLNMLVCTNIIKINAYFDIFQYWFTTPYRRQTCTTQSDFSNN